MIIRPARRADAAAIVRIKTPVVRDTTITFTTDLPTRADVIATIGGPCPLLVADLDGVVGFAGYGPFRPGPGYRRTAEVSVYIDPAAEGQGVARALLTKLEGAARDAGITTLIAGISDTNDRAAAVFAHLGYSRTGHLPGVGWKFGQALGLIVMQKSLGPRTTGA